LELSATTTAATTATAPAPAPAAFGVRALVNGVERRRLDTVAPVRLDEVLVGGHVGRAGARQLLARQDRQAGRGCGRRGRTGSASVAADPTPRGRRPRLPRPRPAPAAAATARGAGALGLLVGDLRHREVLLAVAGDTSAGAGRALLDAGELGDVGEEVGDLDQVRRRVAAEADDLDPDAHLLDGADRRREVAVPRHDDRDVEVAGGLHEVDDELDVEVGLDLAVAVLADVLADDLVVVPRQEGAEVALVFVIS